MSSFAPFIFERLLFGVELTGVHEVIRSLEMTRVPLAPAVVSGLINLRGQIVPAVDLRLRDTKPDPSKPRLAKVIEPEEVMKKTGYSRPHTSHCGPDGVYINTLGSVDGSGPGGIFVLDPETFESKGSGKRSVVPNTSHTISGGIWDTTP